MNFTVHDTYAIKSAEDCNVAPEIPAGSTVLVLGSNRDCKNCFAHLKIDLFEGEDYLVAGVKMDRVGNCDGKFWVLPGSSSTSLIVEWESKLNKKITTYVDNGNEERSCS